MLTALIECGGTPLGAALAAGLVQRVAAFVAPLLIGSAIAPGPVGDPGSADLGSAPRFRWIHTERVGDDMLLEGESIS